MEPLLLVPTLKPDQIRNCVHIHTRTYVCKIAPVGSTYKYEYMYYIVEVQDTTSWYRYFMHLFNLKGTVA